MNSALDAKIASSYAQIGAQNAQKSPAPAAKTGKDIDKTAEDFEAFFLSQMLGHMFEGVGEQENMFGGGHGEKMFKSLLIDEYGKLMARTGQVGIADAVRRQMLQAQESQESWKQ